MADQTVDYSKIDEVDEVDEAGVRLFKVMMRLEFALKEIGYVTSGRQEAAEVEWDRYANAVLGKTFLAKLADSQEAAVLFKSPPQRQIVNQSGNLSWEPVQTAASIQDFIGALRRVRNNLFHGGKSGDPDRDRNQALYAAALFVVDQILLHDERLRTVFTGDY